MKIKYLGPSPGIIVAPYGSHTKDEVKDYPDDFGEDLLATSKKQKFEAVDADGIVAETGALEDMTVVELKELLDKLGLAYNMRAPKAELVETIKANTGEPPAEE